LKKLATQMMVGAFESVITRAEGVVLFQHLNVLLAAQTARDMPEAGNKMRADRLFQ